MKLSPHFALEELTHSGTAARFGMDNTPGTAELENLKQMAWTMESIRTVLHSYPIVVHSGYRSRAVNTAVGGVGTSAHCKGLACDFVCPECGSPAVVAKKIADSGLPFDQLILEYGWVHIGLAEPGKPSRYEILTKTSASAPYVVGIVA